MSTENVEVFNRYRGNGAATQFSIGFPYLKREYVKVYLFKGATGEEVKLSSNRFSFVNDSTIKFPVLDTDEILQEGDILTVQRETTLGSEFEFDNQRRLFPVEVMNADDLSFQQIQELRREINRSVRVNPTAEEAPEELLNTVYDKLDSATSIAGEAIAAADQATIAAEKATVAVETAEKQVVVVTEYIDEKKLEIDTIVAEAEASVDDAITQATEDVKQAALEAAQESIRGAAEQATNIVVEYAEGTIKPELTALAESANTDAADAAYSAREAKAWARGEDAEVEEFAPGQEEHSSRGYADLAMAIANTPEDVPVDMSKLLALDVIRGPKGDAGSGEFSGDIQFEGSFNVHGDDNHPVKVTSLAGATASGYQVVDSNGAGESDFEHAATGDRYITRIANKSTATGKTVNVDLYQTTAGKSVLDLSKPDTILAPQLLDMIYPVGSIYITTNATCPIADLGVGTWELVAEDRVLQGAGTRGAVGTELAESLPNITGEFKVDPFDYNGLGVYGHEGAFTIKTYSGEVAAYSSTKTLQSTTGAELNASLSSSTYQDGAPVQPDAYLVNIFRRTM